MNDAAQILWFETWWSWSRAPHEPFFWTEVAGHYFNFIEATAWFVFAWLVLRRWRRCRKSRLEVLYAVAFLLFGVSDLIESQWLTSWLIWWKATNLVVLVWLRKVILSRWYPELKLY